MSILPIYLKKDLQFNSYKLETCICNLLGQEDPYAKKNLKKNKCVQPLYWTYSVLAQCSIKQ